MKLTELDISTILVPPGRKASKNEVDATADSIAAVGLLHAIVVDPENHLISGLHRLRACAKLGWTKIPASIVEKSGIEAELAAIDENLIRHTMSALEYSRQLRRRQEIYEVLYPGAKRGGVNQHTKGKVGSLLTDKMSVSKKPFSEDAAEKLGRSPRQVRRDLAIAKNISDEVAEQIQDTPVANRKSELAKLGKLPAKAQREAASAIASGQAATVDEAMGVTKAYPRDADLPRSQIDDDGNDVPEHLLDVFESRAEFCRLSRKINELVSEMWQLSESAAGYYMEGACGMEAAAADLMGACPSLLANNEVGWLPSRARGA